MAVLGLGFCARAFSSSGKRGPLFIAVRGPLTIGHRFLNVIYTSANLTKGRQCH